MIEVALETSHRFASVALSTGDDLEEVSLEASHASDAVGALEGLMRAAGIEPREIDAVYVGTGPGSYTGLRIGIATALGLARGAGASMRGEPSGESLVWRELAAGEEGVYLLDARQSELYLAHYRRLEDDVEVLRAPAVLAPGQLAAQLPREVAIFGDTEALRIAGLEECVGSLRSGVVPRAGALLELAGRRLRVEGPQHPEAVEPLYLRPFAARVRKR